MFHRVTTEDQDKPEQQPANTNATAEKKSEPVQKSEPVKERALYDSEDSMSATSEPKVEPKIEAKVETKEQPALKKPSYTAPQKAKYSTPNPNRGTTMTSYTRTTQSNETSATETQTHDFSAGSYSRARSTGGYPGASSYTPSAATRSSTTAQTSTSDNDRTLTIGAGITMAGEIESCDYLLVEGTVEAALKGARSLEVAESGVFYGTVEIEEATISGRFEGDITVHGRLTIQSTGVVTGSITYKELEIEGGAVVDGRLTPVTATATQTASAPTATKTRAPAQQKTTTEAEAVSTPANTDMFATEGETTAAE